MLNVSFFKYLISSCWAFFVVVVGFFLGYVDKAFSQQPLNNQIIPYVLHNPLTLLKTTTSV